MERKSNMYGITLGLYSDRQGMSPEEVKSVFENLLRKLRAKAEAMDWHWKIEAVLSDVHGRDVWSMRGKREGFEEFGIYRNPSPTALHIHILLYAEPGKTIVDFILRAWSRAGMGKIDLENNEESTCSYASIYYLTGALEYFETNVLYTSEHIKAIGNHWECQSDKHYGKFSWEMFWVGFLGHDLN